MQHPELDRTDRRLLGVLQENGRASNLELAEAIREAGYTPVPAAAAAPAGARAAKSCCGCCR